MELENNKEVKKQAVSKLVLSSSRFLYLVLFVLILLPFQQCKSSGELLSTNNNGGYTIVNDQGTYDQRVKVEGFVYDMNSEEPLINAEVKYFCDRFLTDSNGYYSFEISTKSDVIPYLITSFIGYRTIETKPFPFANNIKINFFLELDLRDVIHCD